MWQHKVNIHYEKIFNVANVGVYKTTPEGKIVYVNKYLANILGYESEQELMERNLEDSEYYNPNYPREEFKKIIEENGFYKGESSWITRDGKRIHVMEFAVKVKEGGKVYYEGIVENITPLIESYEEEKRLREGWSNLFNAIPDSVIILSEDQTILDANEATLELVKKSKEEIVGEKCYKVFHNTTSPPEGCPFVRMMENEDYSGFSEMVMDTVGGKYLVTVGIYDTNDNEKRIIHFAKDVNQIYDMREKLITSLERYNKTLTLINTVNRIFMKERSEELIIGSTCTMIRSLEYIRRICVLLNKNNNLVVSKACGCELEDRFVKLLNEKKVFDIQEIKINDEDYLIFPMTFESELMGYFVVGLNDELSNEEKSLFNTIAGDLSYVLWRIRIEKEREVAYKEIEGNMEDLTTLVDGIRNPLAVMMGIAEVELNGEVKKKIVEEIERINRVTKSVDRIWKRSEHLREFLTLSSRTPKSGDNE